MPNLIVLKTGSTFEDLARSEGDFEDWIFRGLHVPRDGAEIVDARTAAVLPTVPASGRVVITGSPEMVTDGAPWIEPTAAWLRDLVAAGTPVLGICFGHQLLAHARGGEVGWNPGGRVYGSVEVERLPAGETDDLFGVLPAAFVAYCAHAQSVRTLPAGAITLARSRDVAIQAARYGRRAWGVQFHPEFSKSIMRAYVTRHAERLAENGTDPHAVLAGIAESGAGPILERFGEPGLTRRGGTRPNRM